MVKEIVRNGGRGETRHADDGRGEIRRADEGHGDHLKRQEIAMQEAGGIELCIVILG